MFKETCLRPWKYLSELCFSINVHCLFRFTNQHPKMSKLSASEEKMLMLQHHMRENNMDLESFVKDMNKWEDDIKEKEQKLKSEKAVNGKVCW